MHASNLLKTVLKPRSIASSSSGQPLNGKKDSKSQGPRASASDKSASANLSVTKKPNPAPLPVKMSCLCAPTNHAGSFRCRLHRGTQQSWGGRPVAPSDTTSKPSPVGSPVASGNAPSGAPVEVGNGNAKRIAHQLRAPRHLSINFAQAHRSCDARPSRLSKVSAATDAEAPVSRPQATPPACAEGSMRYLKFTGGSGCASGAVLEGGLVLMKRLQSGGKDVMLDVLSSGTGLSRAGLML